MAAELRDIMYSIAKTLFKRGINLHAQWLITIFEENEWFDMFLFDKMRHGVTRKVKNRIKKSLGDFAFARSLYEVKTIKEYKLPSVFILYACIQPELRLEDLGEKHH
jgi:hypothetical protein